MQATARKLVEAVRRAPAAKTGLDADPAFDVQDDQENWPAKKAKVAALFATRTRDQWCAIMEMTDVCFAPILSLGEAPQHPHNVARGTFIEAEGVLQPAPAPRYSGTATATPQPALALPQLVVADPLTALQVIARTHRRAFTSRSFDYFIEGHPSIEVFDHFFVAQGLHCGERKPGDEQSLDFVTKTTLDHDVYAVFNSLRQNFTWPT